MDLKIIIDSVVKRNCPRGLGFENGKSEEECRYEYETCKECWNDTLQKVGLVECELPISNDDKALEEDLKEENNSIKPNHYNSGKYDIIWFCNHHNLPFWVGNVFKYCFRSGKKDKSKEIEDLNKAIEYINRRIKYLEGE